MSTRAYGGVSAAERRAARYDRLVQAALDIVGADGSAAVTVTRLCREAGLNERYFYESFTDRSEVLVAAIDHVAEVLTGRIIERLAASADDRRSLATAAIGGVVEVLVEDPRKGALFLESAGHPDLASRRAQLSGGFVDLIAGQGLQVLDLPRTAAVEAQATFAATHLFGGAVETIAAWLRGDLKVSRDELVDSNVELFLAIGAAAPGLIGEV